VTGRQYMYPGFQGLVFTDQARDYCGFYTWSSAVIFFRVFLKSEMSLLWSSFTVRSVSRETPL
jgi:hypothetical protein